MCFEPTTSFTPTIRTTTTLIPVVTTADTKPTATTTVSHIISTTATIFLSREAPTTNTTTPTADLVGGFHRWNLVLAMRSLPARQFWRVGIITAFLSLVFIIRLHIQLRADDSTTYFGGHSLLIARKRLHSTISHRLSNSTALRELLPLPFKVIDTNDRWQNRTSKSTAFNLNCTISKCYPSFNICVYAPAVDRYISRALLSSGIWEPYITSAFQIALKRHPNALVVDVGANIGYYSLLASSRGHDVIAVEPYVENQRRLGAGAILTRRQHRSAGEILLLANAMSDGHRFVSLSTSQDNQGGLRVLEGCQQANRPGILALIRSIYIHGMGQPQGRDDNMMTPLSGQQPRRCDIPTLTMDDLLTTTTNKTVIIKVDVEGYECRAMGHATNFLMSNRVPYIFMEWRLMRERQRDLDTACTARQIDQLSSSLSGLGYIPHEIRSGIRLNPHHSSDWQVGDVYWRHKHTPLLVPSM